MDSRSKPKNSELNKQGNMHTLTHTQIHTPEQIIVKWLKSMKKKKILKAEQLIHIMHKWVNIRIKTVISSEIMQIRRQWTKLLKFYIQPKHISKRKTGGLTSRIMDWKSCWTSFPMKAMKVMAEQLQSFQNSKNISML